MSGLLGQVLGSVLGGQGGQPSALAGVLQQVVAGQGGVGGLVSRFQAAGLGGQAQSWVGTGENAPISPDQVGQAFTPDELQAWAQQAGTTPDALRGVLAAAIPHVVDHMTPEGQIPTQAPTQMPDLSSLLGRLLGSAGAPNPG